ncbi:MAG: hydrogenase maturation nickel metallochaperone HypA [Balneolaceae bacterium]|nr:MAG: hydrogenase maturation nickel metallochaperone HypA [Balneolaceae bacterium]
MHELSIALNIVDIASTETRKAGATRVTDLDIEVGSLSGVIVEALEFAMEVAVRDTILSEARVAIHPVKAQARCRKCGVEFEVRDYFEECPECASLDLQITRGQELKVRSLKVE